jgi:hypothetical protein
MPLNNDSVIRYMLRLGQAHMIRRSIRMLKQIHDSQLTHLNHCNDLRGEAIRRFVKSLLLIYSRPFALAAPQRAKAG